MKIIGILAFVTVFLSGCSSETTEPESEPLEGVYAQFSSSPSHCISPMGPSPIVCSSNQFPITCSGDPSGAPPVGCETKDGGTHLGLQTWAFCCAE